MTKFTRDTAFRLMFQSHMTPIILTRIMEMVRHIRTADQTSKPSRMTVTKNIEASDRHRLNTVSSTMVKYCS